MYSMTVIMGTSTSSEEKRYDQVSSKNFRSMLRLLRVPNASWSHITWDNSSFEMCPLLSASQFFSCTKIVSFTIFTAASSCSALPTAVTTSQSTPMSMFITVKADNKTNTKKTPTAKCVLTCPLLNILVRMIPVLSMKVPSISSVHMQPGQRAKRIFDVAHITNEHQHDDAEDVHKHAHHHQRGCHCARCQCHALHHCHKFGHRSHNPRDPCQTQQSQGSKRSETNS